MTMKTKFQCRLTQRQRVLSEAAGATYVVYRRGMSEHAQEVIKLQFAH
jgi:hypothetical protein